LRQLVRTEGIELAREPETPLWWRIQDWLSSVLLPLSFAAVLPALLLYLPIGVFQLRRREESDPEIVPRPDPAYVAKLAALEDHDVTNQFSAMGSMKPGLFRRWATTILLWLLDYSTRHVYVRGHLARVRTIHFARWVFLDDKKRLLFASNYDGSLESYMDDFINKVAFGLNLVFSNGVGYPKTNWLVMDGAKDEQKFKYFIRRHQLPTQVWYNAHKGLTAFDLERNSLIRQGLESATMTEVDLRNWVELL